FGPTPQTALALLAGDFNFPPGNPAFAALQEPLAGGGPAYRDAWAWLNPGAPHAPTFCLHDERYAKSPYCCDFVFASQALAPRLHAIRVEAATRASDHQPVLVELEG
ncbi:MAG TPA: endonuclease, partial [Myxococcota bacterium]|nr:endonuclease [Myxococcota bacterium]